MKQLISKVRFGRDNDLRRREWLRDTLAKVPAGLAVLDAGAGEQRNRSLCGHLHYVSQDFCQYDGKGDGRGLQTTEWDVSAIDIVSDIAEIPVSDDKFDVVLCTEVLEHVPDAVAALKELVRVLKPGGIVIITAPFSSLTHFAPYHFVSGFSRYWYARHLSELGCTIKELSANGSWLDYVAQELWRLPRVGATYSSAVLGWMALGFCIPVLALLRLMKGKDSGSTELAVYGWHVLAEKSGNTRAKPTS